MQRRLLSILVAFVFVATAIGAVGGACNECSVVTNLACISQTQFQVCVRGTPAGDIASCASGYVCSSPSTSICQLNRTGVLGDCAECNVCDQHNNFACTGVQTYALCLNTTTPSALTGSCAPNHVCNREFEQICVDVSFGVPPTCSAASVIPTKLPTSNPTVYSPLDNPQLYCKQLRQNGRFPVGRALSSTCRQYVICFLRNSVWSGALYTCPGRTYFDSRTRLCHDYQPVDCF